jgi:SAM-dependent methyltransferase
MAPADDAGADEDPAARLLRAAADRHGHRPLPWVAAPLQDAERVLDVCCGTGPLAAHLPPGRWIGVDTAPGPGRPRLRADLTALPLAPHTVDGIALLLALPALRALDAVFAELRRVLRPGGTVVLLVPSALVRTPAEARFARALAPVHRGGWVNRSALDQAGWLLSAADFAVLGDDRIPFELPLPDAAAVHALVMDLPRAGIWPPGLTPDVRVELADRLIARSGPGRSLPVPLRRLVARR